MSRNQNLKVILERVEGIIVQRGQERDLDDGERTIPRCVKAFNAITGNNLSNEDGWMFMQILKLCRSNQGSFKEDDYLDNIGYSVLLAEEAFNTNKESNIPVIPARDFSIEDIPASNKNPIHESTELAKASLTILLRDKTEEIPEENKKMGCNHTGDVCLA